YSYPRASIVWEHRQWSNHGIEGRSAAVAFYGDNGTLIVDRGGWKIYGRRNSLAGDATDSQTPHLRNFIDSIRSRTTPAADIDVGQLSSTLCHLGNLSHRLGREVAFDPASMGFGWDGEANALAAIEYRVPWGIPLA
ncbi:MAG: gfo/Idh/MocA family oxidoreductase, partial [Planctomycetaceae bacterium]|nr:gfo/Idh/MocA family oxidoreductase [Planctomycetaceae bacterium]